MLPPGSPFWNTTVSGGWRTVAALNPGAGRFFRWTGTLPRGTQVRLHAGSVVGPALTIV